MDKMTKCLMLTLVIVTTLFMPLSQGRIFDLDLKADDRREIPLSTFGFLKKGTLAVNMTAFAVISPEDFDYKDAVFGFTLDKSGSKGISSYMEDNQGKCILQSPPSKQYTDNSVSIVFFKMNFKKLEMTLIRRGKGIKTLMITDDQQVINSRLGRPVMSKPKVLLGDKHLVGGTKTKREAAKSPQVSTTTLNSANVPKPSAKPDVNVKSGSTGKKEDVKDTSKDKQSDVKTGSNTEKDTKPDLTDNKKDAKSASTDTQGSLKPASTDQTGNTSAKSEPVTRQKIKMQRTKAGDYSAYFGVAIDTDEEEGLYNLYFHNCYNYPKELTDIHLMLKITEANANNYLSAGEMPIPKLYFCLFVLYVLTAIVWSTILKRGSDDVYKIHYLMLSVIMVKSLSCLFRSINSHFISVEGFHREAWAVLYYIVYLTKGALLFSTILLIGAGWAFVKHILSVKEKKLFLIILPLQVLDNVAFIIVEESQEGQSVYTMWKEVFIIIDLLCCGAILFPVVWSIRHLQQSARTDGKAAISLQKLKLFRQFYIMVVCYIYFTRIIAYLIKITVPFQYEWAYDLFRETTSYLFFLVTGWKFRPASNNPYLQVPQDSDDELEMDEVVTESAALDTVKRVNQKEESGTQPKQRESSHEYD
ncbi:protein GPR107-like [Pecten maximus]|uniref:protein GPR107-like n=1 Tax=Pecten maximus TaxID=6579 RepID=UPI001457F800|nr:protein GPR107-like [Pecten maximus]